MKKIILVLLSVTLFTNIGFCDKPFFDGIAKFKRLQTLLEKDGTIKDIAFYNYLKSQGKVYRPVQSPDNMVKYWMNFIEICQDRGYYTAIFDSYYKAKVWRGPKVLQGDSETDAFVRDMNKVFQKLNPGVSKVYDEFNIVHSAKVCRISHSNKSTYREYGDITTDGTGEETDTFYCTFLN